MLFVTLMIPPVPLSAELRLQREEENGFQLETVSCWICDDGNLEGQLGNQFFLG